MDDAMTARLTAFDRAIIAAAIAFAGAMVLVLEMFG